MVTRRELKESHNPPACACLTQPRPHRCCLGIFWGGLCVLLVCGFNICCSAENCVAGGGDALVPAAQPRDRRGGFLRDLQMGHIWTFWVRSFVSRCARVLLAAPWMLHMDSAQQGKAKAVMAPAPFLLSPWELLRALRAPAMAGPSLSPSYHCINASFMAGASLPAFPQDSFGARLPAP